MNPLRLYAIIYMRLQLLPTVENLNFFFQVVFILEKVHIIWEPLLLPVTYKRCMSMVLEAVFSRITKDILLLDDMAAEETLQVHLMKLLACIWLDIFILS